MASPTLPRPSKSRFLSATYLLPLLLTAVYLVLIGCSALFYEDRVFYSDSAYYLFQIIQKGGFHVEHGRYGAIPGQLLPLLGVKAGLGIGTVALLYSVSVPLLTGLWSLWVYLRKRSHAATYIAALLLVQVLFTRHGWFWPVGEMMQALLLMGIGFFYLRQKPVFLPFAVAAFVLALLCHPSAGPVTVALLLSQAGKKHRWRNMAAALFCILLFVLLPRSGYEKEKMSAFLDMDHILHSAFWNYLLNSLPKVYAAGLPLVVYTLYVRRRDLLFWVISLGFSVGWIVLCAASEHTGNSAVLLENAMLPVGAFWIFSAAALSPPDIYTVPFVSAASGLFLVYVLLLQHRTYGPNTALRKRLLHEWTTAHPHADSFRVNDTRRLVADDKIMRNRLPVEFLLQSAKDADGQVVFLVPDAYAGPDPQTVYPGDGLPTLTRGELNPAYFRAVPTAGPYIRIAD